MDITSTISIHLKMTTNNNLTKIIPIRNSEAVKEQFWRRHAPELQGQQLKGLFTLHSSPLYDIRAFKNHLDIQLTKSFFFCFRLLKDMCVPSSYMLEPCVAKGNVKGQKLLLVDAYKIRITYASWNI